MDRKFYCTLREILSQRLVGGEDTLPFTFRPFWQAKVISVLSCNMITLTGHRAPFAHHLQDSQFFAPETLLLVQLLHDFAEMGS